MRNKREKRRTVGFTRHIERVLGGEIWHRASFKDEILSSVYNEELKMSRISDEQTYPRFSFTSEIETNSETVPATRAPNAR